MANPSLMRAVATLLGVTVAGGVSLLLWGDRLGEATRLACLLSWIGMGVLSSVSFFLRQGARSMGQVLLPSLLRLVLLPLWVGLWAWYLSPTLKPYLLVTLLGLAVFLAAEVALSLRNLRGPV